MYKHKSIDHVQGFTTEFEYFFFTLIFLDRSDISISSIAIYQRQTVIAPVAEIFQYARGRCRLF